MQENNPLQTTETNPESSATTASPKKFGWQSVFVILISLAIIGFIVYNNFMPKQIVVAEIDSNKILLSEIETLMQTYGITDYEQAQEILDKLIEREMLRVHMDQIDYVHSEKVQQLLQRRWQEQKSEILSNAYVHYAIEAKVQPDDEFLRNIYEDDPYFTIHMIFVQNDAAKADSLHQALEGGASFEDLAKAHSEEPVSAEKGGFVGNIRPSELSPLFGEAIQELGLGQYSDVIHEAGNYYIIFKKEQTPFEEMREGLLEDHVSFQTQLRQGVVQDSVLVNAQVDMEMIPQFFNIDTVDELAADAVLVQGENFALKARDFYLIIQDFPFFKEVASEDLQNSQFLTQMGELAKELYFRKWMAAQSEKNQYAQTETELQNELEEAQKSFNDQQEAMALDMFYREQILDKITTPEDSLRAFYTANQDMFFQPQLYHLQQIVLDSRGKANAVIKRLQGGASFGEMVQDFSIDRESAQKGGRLSPMSERDLPAVLQSQTGSLQKGKFTSVLEEDEKFYIFYVNDIQDEQYLPFESERVQNWLRQTWLEKKSMEALENFIEQIRPNFNIKIYHEKLQQLFA